MIESKNEEISPPMLHHLEGLIWVLWGPTGPFNYNIFSAKCISFDTTSQAATKIFNTYHVFFVGVLCITHYTPITFQTVKISSCTTWTHKWEEFTGLSDA